MRPSNLPHRARIPHPPLQNRSVSSRFGAVQEELHLKAVILAGGYGTRLAEETTIRPKPMVEIGGMPILWHIMKIYSHWGINDFIVCCGYKGYMIKEFFANYHLRTCDLRVDMRRGRTEVIGSPAEPWTVTLVDTGEKSGTGGRLRRVRDLVGNETFCFTYGDGVSNVNIRESIVFHRQQGVQATLTAVQPPGRFGAFDLPDKETRVRWFKEKHASEQTWVNGGFFVLEPSVFDSISGDPVMWEAEPMESLAARGQLAAFKHGGFWRCMDHLSDKVHLEELWASGKAPWRLWP
jgi:glucose-1-phosphate cytidylyltransferase